MAGPYSYAQIGRKRGDKVTCTEQHPDCGCTLIKKVRKDLVILEYNAACPVHQDAPE